MERENTVPGIQELRARCQSTAPNPMRESILGKFARRFSIYWTWIFLHTRTSPNQITFLSVVVFFIGIAFFWTNTFIFNLIGCAIIFLSIVLDGSDGEVARFRKTAGVTGTLYVEPVSHDIQYGFMFLLLGTFFTMNGFSWMYVLLGGIAGITKLLYRLLEIRYWDLTQAQTITVEKVEQLKQDYYHKPWFERLFYWLNKNFFSSTGVFVVILACTLLNHINWYLWIYAVCYAGLWVLLFAKQFYSLFIKKEIKKPTHGVFAE